MRKVTEGRAHLSSLVHDGCSVAGRTNSNQVGLGRNRFESEDVLIFTTKGTKVHEEMHRATPSCSFASFVVMNLRHH